MGSSGSLPGISLTDKSLDFAQRTQPRFSYIVASTERSGSNILCTELWQTGFLGAPVEYFNFNTIMIQMIVRLNAQSLNDYVRRLVEVRTSPNGVFAFKAHWEQFQFVLLSKLINQFPVPRWIFIDRSDIIAQTISYAKAIQTQQWHTLAERRAAPQYSFEQIFWCYSELINSKKNWRSFFESMKITPMIVFYEEFIKDPGAKITEIGRWLDFPTEPRANVAVPKIARQGDQTNLEWAEKFKKEAAQHGYAL